MPNQSDEEILKSMEDKDILRKAIRAVEGKDKLEELKKYIRETYYQRKGRPYHNTLGYLAELKKQYDRIKWEKDNKQEYKAVKNTRKEKVKTERILPMATYKAYGEDDILTYTDKTNIHQDLHKAMISSGRRKKEEIQAEVARREEQIVKDVERECETLLLTLTMGTLPRHFSVSNHQYIFQVNEGFINKRDIPQYAKKFAKGKVSALGESLWKKYTEEEYAEYVRTCRGFTREYIIAHVKYSNQPGNQTDIKPDETNTVTDRKPDETNTETDIKPDETNTETDRNEATGGSNDLLKKLIEDMISQDIQNDKIELSMIATGIREDLGRYKFISKELKKVQSLLTKTGNELTLFEVKIPEQGDNEPFEEYKTRASNDAVKQYREKGRKLKMRCNGAVNLLYRTVSAKFIADMIVDKYKANRIVEFILENYQTASVVVTGEPSKYLEYDSDDLEELRAITFSDTE